jgi:isohexenylglutaconyl-CoA hydratase
VTATDPPAPDLLVHRDGPVVRAVLNRPSRRNAMNAALATALDLLLADLAQDRTARVLVISGAGGHFCAGLDLAEVAADAADPAAQQARNAAIGARFQAIADLPQIVVASVRGAAHAGGLGLVCAADIALADASARFCAPELRRGLVPAQILPWLVRRMGRSGAARMLLQGHVMDAAEAGAAGLVHAVLADAAALAATLDLVIADALQAAPGAIAETKALLAALGPVAPPAYAALGAAAFARTAAGPEAAEGMAAFREKRPPVWTAGATR